MTTEQIAQALKPFLRAPLAPAQLSQLAAYLDLLLKWNSRMNLTAVRRPEDMVSRHFGESLFAAQTLFPESELAARSHGSLIDLGSGAGFPGLPIKVFAPEVTVVLVESQHKKATFLKEAIRAMGLSGIRVHAGRAEDSGLKSETVTLRAVEKFEVAAKTAADLVGEGGRLALLIGESQAEQAAKLLSSWKVVRQGTIPESKSRILLIMKRQSPTA